MFVAPAPVRLLIVVVELGKIAIFAMVLFCVHTVRLIFMSIPLMIVIVFFVVAAIEQSSCQAFAARAKMSCSLRPQNCF